VHFLLGALPDIECRTSLKHLVIGIGNDFRHDDGVGLTVAEAVARLNLPAVQVLTAIGEPGALIDAWATADSVVVVDAAVVDDPEPGRLRRWTPDSITDLPVTSTHAFGLAQTYGLGRALGRLPRSLVVLSVDIADTSDGLGLSDAVAAVVPNVVDAVLAEFGLGHHGTL
jgi:hydrogenase maturation protease